MRILLCIGWLALVACGRKHDNGEFKIETHLKTNAREVTGPPGLEDRKLSDAKPALAVTASDPQLADGMRAVLAASERIQRGALTVAVETTPATPASPDGSCEVTITATAVFARLPEISALTATINGTVTYENLDPRELGGELGKTVIAWIDGAKLPAQLGLPTGPVAPAKQVAVAAATCSLHADGSVRCWDRDAQEVPMPALRGTKALEGANQFGACGLRADGRVFCIDAWDNNIAFAARNVCGIAGATAISVGQSTACALRDDGHVVCWAQGPAWYEPCDKGHPAVEVTGIANAVAIDVGAFRGCAVLRDGTVSCWEHCDKRCKSGVVGKVDVSPIAHSLQGAKATQVAVEFGVYTVNGNRVAYLGGRAPDKPYEVTFPEPVKRLVQTSRDMCALGEGGHVFCFGPAAKPEPIAGLADVAWLDGDINGACAVTAKGEVLCWSEDGFFPSRTPTVVAMPY